MGILERLEGKSREEKLEELRSRVSTLDTNKVGEIEAGLSKSVYALVGAILTGEEYTKAEIKRLSPVVALPWMRKWLDFNLKKRKDIDRKNILESKESLRYIAKAIAREFHAEKERSLLDKIKFWK